MTYRISKISIEKVPFVGTLFCPDSSEKHTGIIVVPGSDGGIPEALAEHVASQGYVVLALGYFGLEGLPSNLENIPLEYFQKAIAWMRELPEVKKDRLALLGYSRGGELVLLLGTLFPDLINGIIAYVPSSLVCGGFPHPNQPAWLFNKQPIAPYLHGLMSSEPEMTEAEDLSLACKEKIIAFHANTAEDPYEIADLFLARHKNSTILLSAAIPVENIKCPILIIAGGQDKIWPSALYGKLIMERLDQKRSNIERKLLIYPEAGHGIIAPYEGPIYHPVGQFWCTLGGTPSANTEANKQSWQEVLSFLKRLL